MTNLWVCGRCGNVFGTKKAEDEVRVRNEEVERLKTQLKETEEKLRDSEETVAELREERK